MAMSAEEEQQYQQESRQDSRQDDLRLPSTENGHTERMEDGDMAPGAMDAGAKDSEVDDSKVEGPASAFTSPEPSSPNPASNPASEPTPEPLSPELEPSTANGGAQAGPKLAQCQIRVSGSRSFLYFCGATKDDFRRKRREKVGTNKEPQTNELGTMKMEPEKMEPEKIKSRVQAGQDGMDDERRRQLPLVGYVWVLC